MLERNCKKGIVNLSLDLHLWQEDNILRNRFYLARCHSVQYRKKIFIIYLAEIVWKRNFCCVDIPIPKDSSSKAGIRIEKKTFLLSSLKSRGNYQWMGL